MIARAYDANFQKFHDSKLAMMNDSSTPIDTSIPSDSRLQTPDSRLQTPDSRPSSVVIDLDGTILHAEPAEIGVWGRTAYRYLSRPVADRLAELSNRVPVILATGRHARSVAGLVSQLPDVNFAGFVLENGEHSTVELAAETESHARWDKLFEKLPGWTRLDGFARCLGVIPPPDFPSPDDVLLELLGGNGHLWRDGKKRFLHHAEPSKARGVRALGFEVFLALGNETNDLDLLETALHLGAPSDSHPAVRALVSRRGGFESGTSHAGSVELLDWALSITDNTLFREKA
jgi:hypothetical protein